MIITGITAFISPDYIQAGTLTGSTSATTSTLSESMSGRDFGPDILIQKGSFSNGFASNIESTLRRMGFTQNGDIYSKDGISVNTSDPLMIKVTFSNHEQRDAFIQKTTSLGYKWDGTKCLNGKQLTLDIAVDDDTISIYFID